MENKEKRDTLKALVAEAYAAVGKAEKFATDNSMDFNFSIDYGMGGTFVGDKESVIAEFKEWNDREPLDWEIEERTGWVSSSANC